MKKAVAGIITVAIIGGVIILYYPTPLDVPVINKILLCSGNAECFDGKVTRIVDGDTIYVNGVSIRLALTSTPELSENGGVAAKEFTESLCPPGSKAVFDEDDGQTEGSYDRLIGVVYCGDVMLNSALLDAGHAYIDKNFCAKSEFGLEEWAQAHGC